jgi:uncharacterized protein YukE
VNRLCLTPERLREEARYFRFLVGQLDFVCWRLRTSWQRLDLGWQGFATGAVDEYYNRTTRDLKCMADAFYQCAWMLDATAAWIETADMRAGQMFESCFDS